MYPIRIATRFTAVLAHVGDHWHCLRARRRINGGPRQDIDVERDEALRFALDIDRIGHLAPSLLTGKSVFTLLRQELWERTRIVGWTPGREVVVVSWREFEYRQASIETRGVDLKWGLWTDDEGLWQESGCSDELAQLRRAFYGERPPLKIDTAPRKEIRYGTVIAEHGALSYAFRAEWDETYELAQLAEVDLDAEAQVELEALIDDFLQCIREELPFDFAMAADNIGAYVSGVAMGDDFETAMAEVDAAEGALLEIEQENSAELDRLIKEWVAQRGTSGEPRS